MAIDDFANLVDEVGPALHAIDQVRPVERADENFGRLEAKLADDVLADVRRGGGRVGMDGDVGKHLLEPPQLAVFGAEIVSPFADAVGFVDGDERDRRLLQEFERAVGHQPLGRQIEQLEPAGANFIGDVPLLGRGASVLLTQAAATPQSISAST